MTLNELSWLDSAGLASLCAKCEHATVVEASDGRGLELDRSEEAYYTHCLDCPVQMCREGMMDSMAEAYGS
jgi:hypothetical protein